MKLEDVQKTRKSTIKISGMITHETHNYIKKNNINVGKLLDAAVQEIQHKQQELQKQQEQYHD